MDARARRGRRASAVIVAARALARSRRVVLVDADPSAELGARLGARPIEPLGDLYGVDALPAAWAQRIVGASGLAIVPIDRGRFVASGLSTSPRSLDRCLEAADARADVVLVDLPPPGAQVLEIAMPRLDALVLVVPANAAGVRAVPGALRLVLAHRETRGHGVDALAVGPSRGPAGAEIAAALREIAEPTPVISLPHDDALELDAAMGPRGDERCSEPYRAAVETLLAALEVRRAGGSAIHA